MDAIITSNCSYFNAEYQSSFLATKLHFLYTMLSASHCVIWTVAWLSYISLEGWKAVGIWVTEFMGDLWYKQNTAIWLELHNFRWQTQNLLLVSNPTICKCDVLGPTQLDMRVTWSRCFCVRFWLKGAGVMWQNWGRYTLTTFIQHTYISYFSLLQLD